MNDMRRQTLRMADGGSFITRWANNVMKPAQSRLRQMDAPAPPAPVVAPPPQTAAPVTAENPAGIRFADGGGLRGDPYRKGSMDGGRVVGEGGPVDDKVPAKYSPGEYVLPADTASAIGHENLDAIKDATHTPAAVQRGYDLRDNPQGDRDGGEVRNPGQNLSLRGEVRSGPLDGEGAGLRRAGGQPGVSYSGRGDGLRQVGLRLADGGIPGIGVSERPWAGSADSRLFAQQPGAGNPNVGTGGSPQAQAFRSAQSAGVGPQTPGGWSAAPGAGAAPAAKPTLRNPLTWAQGVGDAGRATGQGAAQGIGTASKFIGEAGKSAAAGALRHGNSIANAAAATVGHGNAFFDDAVPTSDKLRIAATDAAAGLGGGVGGLFGAGVGSAVPVAGTLAGGVAGAYGGEKAGRWLGEKVFGGSDALLRNGYDPKRGALEVGKDAFSNGFSDDLFGKKTLRAGGGRGFVNPPLAGGQSPTPTLRDGASPSPNPTDRRLAAGTQATPAPGQDPGRVTLRGMAGADLDGAPGVSKFVQNGKTLYSNVPGADNDKLMSNNPGVSTIPGMSQAQIDRTLTNPDGSRWSESDNATMAANLRDGQDAYRGTSRGQAKPQFINAFKAQTDRRGQDINAEVALAGRQMASATARNAARIDQMNKDRGYNLDVQKFGEEKAKTLFTQREQADKDLTGSLEAMFTTRDDKGNSVVDRDKVATHKAGITSYIGNTITQLQAVPKDSPDYAQAQQTAAELQSKNASALSPDRLQKLIAQLEVKERSAAASGYGPFSGSHVDSSDPSEYQITGVDKGLFQDQYIYGKDGKGRIPTRALDFDKGGNPILPNTFGNRPTTRFDIVKKDLRNGN